MSTHSSVCRLSLALVLALALVSCESVPNLSSGTVQSAMQRIQAYTGSVNSWSSKLGDGAITDGILKQLAQYSEQAGGLSGLLGGLLKGADDETQKKISPVQDGLKRLGGRKADELAKLDPAQQKSAVNDFSSAAAKLAEIVKGLMGS